MERPVSTLVVQVRCDIVTKKLTVEFEEIVYVVFVYTLMLPYTY